MRTICAETDLRRDQVSVNSRLVEDLGLDSHGVAAAPELPALRVEDESFKTIDQRSPLRIQLTILGAVISATSMMNSQGAPKISQARPALFRKRANTASAMLVLAVTFCPTTRSYSCTDPA